MRPEKSAGSKISERQRQISKRLIMVFFCKKKALKSKKLPLKIPASEEFRLRQTSRTVRFLNSSIWRLRLTMRMPSRKLIQRNRLWISRWICLNFWFLLLRLLYDTVFGFPVCLLLFCKIRHFFSPPTLFASLAVLRILHKKIRELMFTTEVRQNLYYKQESSRKNRKHFSFLA